MYLKKIGILSTLSLSLLLTGCGNKEEKVVYDGVGEAVNYTVTGIEPGAGITDATHRVLDEYENLAGWEIEESSTAGMLILLDEAIKNEEPIVVTGWTPHWMFEEFDLKFLDDPKNVYGGIENIHTLARLDLDKDMPNAYKILDAFQWDVEDMQAVMAEAEKSSFEEAAENWVTNNQEKVNEWLAGTEKVDGETIRVVSVPWESEQASSNVIKYVLTEQGYNVELTEVDPAIMFQAVAMDSADVTVAPWLPMTHKTFYEQHKDNVVDLGPNMEGARSGLAVPTYVEIDSIEELEAK
ncbi:glycine/betaine ABC transporter [Lysinibacillus macroides]|uniref:Glycine/betaine ABC transporter n=1 Tax=Lysinibacillus macroides TaxID=33935 RepID=A0A0M9DM46_9BACI|nr:glycine betaine ABC transporter substrate-binding protein [Lysinibacillus macroides]KOY83216.1 glycine/betaine ABC transporter [Lysinibacillus macroides]QPR69076.1 glycine/betaine ABC transporter [Lysinibacillus macroides]